MGLQEKLEALDKAVDVLCRHRDWCEFVGADADDLTDLIEGIIKHMAEISQ